MAAISKINTTKQSAITGKWHGCHFKKMTRVFFLTDLTLLGHSDNLTDLIEVGWIHKAESGWPNKAVWI